MSRKTLWPRALQQRYAISAPIICGMGSESHGRTQNQNALAAESWAVRLTGRFGLRMVIVSCNLRPLTIAAHATGTEFPRVARAKIQHPKSKIQNFS
jgi:hypothetical protein